MTLRFVSTDESMQAHYDFRSLLASSDVSVQMAFAYFSRAGWKLLGNHQSVLEHDKSFLVVSVDLPTDLEAVCRVAQSHPGKVYLHLGWVTPYEKKVGPALMHSKLALGRSHSMWRLWVGSQNLTARGMAVGNMEAALVYECESKEPPISDAEMHLERCRSGARICEPHKLSEYLQIQRNKALGLGITGKVLVIYAEEEEPITDFPTIIHVRIPNEDYDDLTRTGAEAHVILVPPGTLFSGGILPQSAKRYTGVVIEDNRTELHSLRGSASTMPHATHWLDLGVPPRLVKPNSTRMRAVTQAAIKIDQRPGLLQPAPADEFLYSVTATRVIAEASATPEKLTRRDVPDDLLQFYSTNSQDHGDLIFAPREHLTEAGRVTIYEGTPIPARFVEALERTRLTRRRVIAKEQRVGRRVELKVTEKQPENEADPFFFRSEFRVRSDDDSIE